MIAYEELVAALTNWRARQGLPTGHTDFLGELPSHLSTTIVASTGVHMEEIAADSLVEVEEVEAFDDVEAVQEIEAYDVVGEQTDVAVALGDDDSVQYAAPAAYDPEPAAAYEEAPLPAEDLGYGEAAGELGYGDDAVELAPAASDYEYDAPTAIAGEQDNRADTDDGPFDADSPFEAPSDEADSESVHFDASDEEATMIASGPEPSNADDSTMDVDIEAEALLVSEEDAPVLPGADIETAPMAAMDLPEEPPPLAPPPLEDVPVVDEPTMDVDLSDVVEESDPSS